MGRSVTLRAFYFVLESIESEMRNQFLFRKEENAIFLFVNPDRNICFFGRIGNQKYGSQVTQFAELAQAHLSFRRTPRTEKDLLIEPLHEQMGVLGYLFRTGFPETWNEI